MQSIGSPTSSESRVDALATAVRDLKASKGVIFTTKGFQSGAVTNGRSSLVWKSDASAGSSPMRSGGRPGRHVDFNIQYFQRSIGSPDITAAAAGASGRRCVHWFPRLHLHIGGEEGEVDTTDHALRTRPTARRRDSLEKLNHH